MIEQNDLISTNNMMTKQLSIINRVDQLQCVTQFVDDIAKELSLNEEMHMNIGLVLEEMVSKFIFYAYSKDTKGTIDISAKSDGQTITLLLSDNGRAFDPTHVENIDMNTNPAQRPLGGMGIYIVKNIMNHVSYQRLHGRNQLTMSINITTYNQI